MRIPFKHIALVVLLSLSIKLSAGQNNDSLSDSIEAWDNSVVDYRHPSVDTIAYYKNLAEYQYETSEEDESLWSRFWRWLISKFVGENVNFSWLGWLLLILAVLALLAIVIRLFGIPIKGLFVFSRSTKVTELSFSSGDSDLENERLEDMLAKYCNTGAYREATRVLFLLTLRQMNRSKMIKWHAWKTDREYYYEIEDKKLKEQFLSIMRQYEYIWYGKFMPEQHYFNDLQSQFEHFTKTVTVTNN